MFNITSRLNFTRTLGSTVVLGIILFLSVPAATYAVSLSDVIVTSLSYANGVFTSTVKNQGTGASPSGVIIGVAYSVDGVAKTFSDTTIGPLAAGASITIGTSAAPYTIPAGTHTIRAYVDDVNRFAESSETNNQLSQSIAINPSLPDVIVTSLSYANGVFTSTVKNQGTGAIPSGVIIGVAYSVDGVAKTFSDTTIGPLAAGASITIGTSAAPYTIPAGTHTIRAYVDDVNRFAESSETNNQLSQSITTINPTLSLTANPVQVGTGGAATLSWASQHTTSCTASGGWSGSKGTSGSETVKNITSNQTYNLTCAGTTKNISASANVKVASTQPDQTPMQPFVVGIGPQQHSGNFDAAGQAFINELGAHSIRVGYNHGDHNFGVNWAAQNGVGVLFFLGYRAGCDPRTAAGRQCYADRSAGLAKTYGSKVQYYEIWNEWDGGWDLGCVWNQPNTPCTDYAMYTDLLCRTYKAVKAVSPNAKIVGGVTAGTDFNFISRMLDNGAANCMDVISVHPYVYAIRVPYHTPASAAVDYFIKEITTLNNMVIQKIGRSIPIIVSEEGRNDGGNPAEQQLSADYLTQLYTRARALSFLEGIWWYELEDAAFQPGWGVLRNNNTRKSSFAAFQAEAKK